MNYRNSSFQNNHKNLQNGGELKGERLENFRKKYGYFTKTYNLVTNELKNLGKDRKIKMTKKSDFCAYLNTKNLPYQFLFKNLNSSIGDNISDEFKEYFKLLKNDEDKIIVAMPLFVRFTTGLVTNILFYNISKQNDNYIINVERINTYNELAITEVDDLIDRHLNVELSIDDIDITITIKTYKFDTAILDIDIDDVNKSLIYSLYFMSKQFQNPDNKTLQDIYNNITANTTRKEITNFASKLNILEDIDAVEEELNEKIDKDIIKKLLERPDLKTKNLISSIDTIFNEMEITYEQFDQNAISIENLTEQIESSTQKIMEIYEDKKKFYNDLKNTRKTINEDIDKIYSELNKLKDAIIFGVENLILHRGIISKQLQKFEKLSGNSKIYEEKKDVFEKIKKNLENMVSKQQEYDNKITILKEQLENKKNEILEKNTQIQETNEQISTTEKGLNILKSKLQYYTQKGGKNMKNVLAKVKKNNSIQILKENKNLLLNIKNILGGTSKSVPEKLNNNLNKILDENSNLKNKKTISEIIDDITPIILKYKQNIDQYHDTLVNRDNLKKSLQEAFIKMRKFEQTFSDTKYKLENQGDSIQKNIQKMEIVIKQMENDEKPQNVIDKIKDHKLKLIEFINTRGNYIQKVEQLNDTLVQRKKSLNTSKNDVRNKLKELQTIGDNLDEIKNELESHTNMYGGNILNKAILKSKVKKDDYLRYLTNPIEYIIKGGNNKLSKLKNQWKLDHSDYIFNNFEFNDLKTVAKKWGISNLDKFKTKKDLGLSLKLILYTKVGLITDFQNLVLVSYFLDIDISDVDKHDIGEINKRINKKTKNIPFNSDIQSGGAFISDDVIRFIQKDNDQAVSSKIIIHIPTSFKKFKETLEKNSEMKIITRKLSDDNQLIESGTTKIKNGIFDGSYTAKILKLEDFTNPEKFYKLAKIKTWWMKGSYLNIINKLKNSIISGTTTMYPETQYTEIDTQKFPAFVSQALSSHDSIIAIKDILQKPEYKFEPTKKDFNHILQQHVNQLINLNSVNLAPYVTNLHNNLDLKSIRIFKTQKVKDFEQIISQQSEFISSPITAKDQVKIDNLTKSLNEYFIPPTNNTANIDYNKHRKENKARIVVKEVFHNGTEEQQKKEGLISGQIIGYKLYEKQPLDLKYLEFVVYNKFYTNPNPYSKNNTDKQYHNSEPITPNSQPSHTIKNVFNKDIEIISISKDKTDDILTKYQTGGGDTQLKVITKKTDPTIIEGILPHPDHHKLKTTISKDTPPSYIPRDPKSEELMDNPELENHINRIGQLLLEINDKGQTNKPRTRVGVFNIIGNKDESIVINKNKLIEYLLQIEHWLKNYNPTQTQVLELYQIIDYIKKFYKGNNFDAVIKSQKMQLLERLNDIKKENEKDSNKIIPKLSSRITYFIEEFRSALQIYDEQFMTGAISTKNFTEFFEHEIQKTKGYLLKKHADKLKKTFCIESKKPDCEINNKQFPVNEEAKTQIKNFIEFVSNSANKAEKIENDILFVEILIIQLEQLLTIFANDDIQRIVNIRDIDLAKKIRFPEVKQRLINERDYDKNKQFSEDDIKKLISGIKQSGGGFRSLLARIPMWLQQTYQPLSRSVLVRQPMGQSLLHRQPMGNQMAQAILTQQPLGNVLLSQIQLGHTILTQIDQKFAKLIEESLTELRVLHKTLLDNYKKIGEDDTNNFEMDNNDIKVYQFVTEYLIDLQNHIETNYNTYTPPTDGPIDVIKQAQGTVKDTWDELVKQIDQKEKEDITEEHVNGMFKQFKQGTSEKFKSFWGTMKQMSTGGGERKNTENVNDIFNKLFSSIRSTYRTNFKNIKKSSNDKAILNSTINDRFTQLKQLAKLRRYVAKEMTEDDAKPKHLQESLQHMKKLDELIREKYVIDSEYKITENVYDLIDENNPDLKLPDYHLVSHLQFVIMVGFVNKFEKMWKSDTSFHGKYETYIDKLIKGSLFEENNKSKEFDIGNISDDKFLRAYYSDLIKYIKTNNINSFQNFLHKTYTKIFSSSESPNDGYNEFWGKSMYDIGMEWEDLRENPDYNGLIQSIDLFGGDSNVLSAFEQGLLFSFIIHAKDLINEESEEIIQLNPKQKFNKFIKFLPRNTQSYIVISLDSLYNNNTQTGGAGKLERKIYDGKHDIPGRFLFNKNLDNVKHLYIYSHKNGSKDCPVYPLYPKDKKLIENLEFPVDPSGKPISDYNPNVTRITPRQMTVGISPNDTPYKSVLLPNKSIRQKQIKNCAEYRLSNTGKKDRGFSVWEIEKKDFKGDFIPLILWADSELNELEKKIISNSKEIDTSWTGPNFYKRSNEIYQTEKYSALTKLIEKGDFGNYMEQKDIISLNQQFDKLTKKSTKQFWKTNFPELYDLKQNVTKNQTDTEIQKNIEAIINKITVRLEKKDIKTKDKLKKNYDKLDKSKAYTIKKGTKQINFTDKSYEPKYPEYKKYIDEIDEWLNNIEELVK